MRNESSSLLLLPGKLAGLPSASLICSVSYEDRCLAIPQALSSVDLARVVICENRNHKALHKKNGDRIKNLFGDRSLFAWLDTSDPLVTGDALLGAVEGLAAGDAPILVDLTTFTHEGMLILTRLLFVTGCLKRTTFLYSLASEYSVGDPPGQKWLSKGVGEIRSVLGFPGTILPSRPLHLIVLLGLEYQRTIDLIGRFEPSRISLGLGGKVAGASTPGAKRGFEKVKAVFSESDEFWFPALDVVETVAIVEDLVSKSKDYGVVIAAMNTKISTLGMALLGCRRQEIQLCYAQALAYNYKHYSASGDKVMILWNAFDLV